MRRGHRPGLGRGASAQAAAALARLALEARLALGANLALVALGLILVALERLPALGGAALWRTHWTENLEAFVPLAIALGAGQAVLVNVERATVEMEAAFPVERVVATRLVLQQAAAWFAVVVATAAMAWAWGPVAYGRGLVAALGPASFLSGLVLWGASASGRAPVGYLLALGLAVADLVLRVLGAFAAVWPLAFLDLFAYRWNVAFPAWPWVKAAMLASGLGLMALSVARARAYMARRL
jgi:hypothetical protein